MRGGGDPPRPQHCGDAEQQHIPETHHAAKLLLGVGGALRHLAHEVTSSAGISSSWRRKFCNSGSGAASNSGQEPKNSTWPSWRNTTRSASFLAKWVSCVTTTEVFRNFSFSRRMRSPVWAAMSG